MKMAKASDADLHMAFELAGALEALAGQWGACMPAKIERVDHDCETERFELDDHEQCKRVIEYLQALTRSASIFRVVHGMAVLLDPRNKMVDPDADTLEHHPETVKAKGERGTLVILLKEADGVLSTLDPEDTHEAGLLAQLRRDIAKATGTLEPTTQQGIPA